MSKAKDEVGYGRPPQKHQFKKGKSGNPAGRPRRSVSLPTLIGRIRDEMIPIRINGKERKVSLVEASIRQCINLCLTKGDHRALERLLALFERYGVSPMDVQRAEAEEAAEQAISKIMGYFERVVEDDTPMLENRTRREIEECAIVMGCPSCGTDLGQRWKSEPASGKAFFPSRFREQFEATTAARPAQTPQALLSCAVTDEAS